MLWAKSSAPPRLRATSTERKRAESELRRYVDQLSVINRLDRVIFVDVRDRRSIRRADFRNAPSVSVRPHIAHRDQRRWDGMEDHPAVDNRRVGVSSQEPGENQKTPLSACCLETSKRTWRTGFGEGKNWPETDLLRRKVFLHGVLVPLIVKGNVIRRYDT